MDTPKSDETGVVDQGSKSVRPTRVDGGPDKTLNYHHAGHAFEILLPSVLFAPRPRVLDCRKGTWCQGRFQRRRDRLGRTSGEEEGPEGTRTAV